jgi:hypothetical protein
VVVPLGLVSLFWMRMYKPLIENALPQMPVSRLGTGPGFVTDNFTRASPCHRSRVANRLLVQWADRETSAPKSVGDFAAHPQHAGELSALAVQRQSDLRSFAAPQIPTPDPLQIDEAFLWSLGDFRIPLEIWQALTHYNVWIEPVLVSEWVRLIESYCGDGSPGRSRACALAARLGRSCARHQLSPGRRSSAFAQPASRCIASGRARACATSTTSITAFPFAAWPCGDAWNLMPAARQINIQKSNRLVTQAALERASDTISNWWSEAFLSQGENQRRQFFLEAHRPCRSS